MKPDVLSGNKNLLPYKGEVYYFGNLFTPAECIMFMQKLLTGIEWKQEPITIFGKSVMQPRLTAWYGNSGKVYTYSGHTMQPLPFTNTLVEIKNRIENIAGTPFNSVLLNQYRNGNDSMGWHRDNEAELGSNPIIGSVSFGASRVFKMRDYQNKTNTKSFELTDGSFLLMKGSTQHYWEHSVPKTAKPVATRINLTFRNIL